MKQELQSVLSEKLGATIRDIQSVSGGDISRAYQVETSTNRFFLKVNDDRIAADMFRTEKKGLEAIAASKAIKTPKVMFAGVAGDSAFLIMEFIESRRAQSADLQRLGHQLADLHRLPASSFGLDHDNYIGRLPQYNSFHDNWVTFYVKERLLPQLDMARTGGLLTHLEIPKEESILDSCRQLCSDIQPSLLHGDLWGGNYLIDTSGNPYLIDPAIYYGHSEVDIAMSRLFGGFGHDFYSAYFDRRPSALGLEDRIEIYQLYYLLVHLNLFGLSYKGSVVKIMDRYFN